MTDIVQKTGMPLWKALWIVCPLTYLVAIALFALTSYITGQIGGSTTIVVGGQPVNTVTAAWFRHAWYGSVVVQAIALLHAIFCLAIVSRYRNNTQYLWFKIASFAFAIIYLGYVIYCAYGFFYPDPNIRPITDTFK